MRHTPLLAAALALLAGSSARADTVEVSSTTLLTAGQQTRAATNGGSTPDLQTVVPAFEILNVSARDITNPFADDLKIVLNTWGSYELADRRWDNGTGSNLTGDVVTGYVSGRLLDRRLTLRLGREQVMAGVGRMIQIDGGDAVAMLPLGLRLSGYVGSPVSQRFQTRSGVRSWNPAGGDLAYGGRLGWSLAVPGVAGRGLDVGVSANFVQDGSDPVRQEVGADLRLQPLGNLTFTGFGAYSLWDERFSEASVMLSWTALRRLHLNADWRFVAPDLLLARNSIMAVFSAAERNEFGAGFTYELAHGLGVGADYHLQLEPGEDESASKYLGHDARAHVEWEHAETVAGAEVMYLRTLENGYVAGRLFGRRSFGMFFAAADVLAHVFREEINGQKEALTGSLTAGVNLARGWSAVVSGRAGVTPFLEQSYDVMAKLVYNQTYRMREVR
jgi:hypothetical protein